MTTTEANAILTSCNHFEDESYRHSQITMPSGQTLKACCSCWNAHVAARKAARKAELKAEKATRLVCCRCGKKPYSWMLANYPVCGTCKKATISEHNQAVTKCGSLAIFAGGQMLANTAAWYFTQFGTLKEWFATERAANPNLTV